MVEAFLQDLDARWKPVATERIVLRVIGSTALMLQAKYVRGTKDSDVFHTNEIDDDLAKRLLAIAGVGTDVHKRHRLYIQLVRSGLLFRRQVVEWRALDELNAGLRSFRIEVMSVLDVVVSKLKRLNANDLTDIQAMIERELVTHEALIACFRDAVDFTMDAKADDLPQYRANLHRVERDMFGIEAPTPIELPRWVEEE